MDLKSKVVNLVLAEKLKELSVEQKSLFYWEYLNEKAYSLKYFIHSVCPRDADGFKHFSAFTSDELMDLLPCFVDTKKGEPYNNFWLEVHKRAAKNIQYAVKYICDTQGIDRYGSLATATFTSRNIYDENLANALAKMLILLIEENLYVKREPIDTGEIL
jgi:hypothetical protein